MAKVHIGAGPTNLSDGLLQLQNGDAMDATLRIVTDQNNTTSPLKLSTGLVSVSSTLQIATSDTQYLDAEDLGGNNRFTISRNAGSQVVNVDFASNPTLGTDQVGAIRTYRDGVSLSDSISFLKNGNVGVGTNAPTSNLQVNNQSGGTTKVSLSGIGSIKSELSLNYGSGECRWHNYGGGYFPTIYSNNSEALRIDNSQNVGIGTTAPTARTHIKGSGSTSATTSLLVQNSGGTQLLKLSDDGTTTIGNSNNTGDYTFVGSNIVVLKLNDTLNSRILAFYKNSGSNYIADTNSDTRLSYGWSGNYFFRLVGTTKSMAISSTTSDPTADASAIVDFQSTTKGFLPPRMTTTQKNAIASPAAGLVVYDTTLNKLCVYTTAWETITSI